ncbi:MAG: LptF/LptG family permease [Desulfurivibrionaceae bacterium]
MKKIKLLDRYIIKTFLLQFLLVLAGLIAIYLLIDFVERIDNFQEAGKPISLAMAYFLLKIPFIFYQISPVAILLAGIICLGLLYRRLEIMSLNAAGISLFRIIFPVLAAALISTGFALANAQWILPSSKPETDRIWLKEVKNEVVGGIHRNNHFYFKGDKGIYVFRGKKPSRYQLNDLRYTVWDSNFRVSLFISAETLKWENGRWLARKGRIKDFKTDGSFDIETFKKKFMDFPENPEDFFSPVALEDRLSLTRLIREGVAEYRKGEKDKFIEMNRRLSLIFLGFPLLTLAIPVMLILHRRLQWELALTIPTSCLFAFTAWAAWNAAQAMSAAKMLAPVPASWTIHVVMIILGLFLIQRQNNL